MERRLENNWKEGMEHHKVNVNTLSTKNDAYMHTQIKAVTNACTKQSRKRHKRGRKVGYKSTSLQYTSTHYLLKIMCYRTLPMLTTCSAKIPQAFPLVWALLPPLTLITFLKVALLALPISGLQALPVLATTVPSVLLSGLAHVTHPIITLTTMALGPHLKLAVCVHTPCSQMMPTLSPQGNSLTLNLQSHLLHDGSSHTGHTNGNGTTSHSLGSRLLPFLLLIVALAVLKLAFLT